MTPNPSTAISLESSAEIFLSIGDEQSFHLCKEMAEGARSMGELGDALFSHWATEQAQRAAGKLEAFNERKVA